MVKIGENAAFLSSFVAIGIFFQSLSVLHTPEIVHFPWYATRKVRTLSVEIHEYLCEIVAKIENILWDYQSYF